MHLRIQKQVFRPDSKLLQSRLQSFSKLILPYFSDKIRLFPKAVQHGKHVAGRSPRIGLKKRVALLAQTTGGEINQKLSESRHIVFFSHSCLPLFPASKPSVFAVFSLTAAFTDSTAPSLNPLNSPRTLYFPARTYYNTLIILKTQAKIKPRFHAGPAPPHEQRCGREGF